MCFPLPSFATYRTHAALSRWVIVMTSL
jgi:hypothetical protein